MAYKSANLVLFRFLEPETGPLFCQFLLPIFNTSRGDEIEGGFNMQMHRPQS